MKSILVFIDGTLCDTRHRHPLMGKADFIQREQLLADRAVPGSVDCLQALAQAYEIIYIGARPASTHQDTLDWLAAMGFPPGEVYLADSQAGRLVLVNQLKEKHDFLAGIGDRWDDNELHAEIGCLSIILQEHEGRWETVAGRIERYHRQCRITANRAHLQGKVEGLARVCPLLLEKYGEGLWDAYLEAVLEMAENSRAARRQEDLASFAQYHLNPGDLRDAAKWDDLTRAEDWQNSSVYGLQAFELVEATPTRYVHKVTACAYAELWKKMGRPDIGYQIHCRTDQAWWDRPAWNPAVRFEQPKTLMQGDDCCLFIQTL